MSLGRSTTSAVDHGIDLINLCHQSGGVTSGEQLHRQLRSYGVATTELDAEDLERLARDLRSVFVPAASGQRVERLNELLDRFNPTPRIVMHDGQAPHFHYVAVGSAADHIGSSFVMAFAETVVDHGMERFGWCAAPTCDNLFFDRSRNRSQRYCSRSCATRVNVRAHRARQ